MTDPVIFLIDTLFSLYILAVLLRLLLQVVGADFYNPVSQFLIKITHPPLRLLRRVIPPIGRVDTSSVVLALGLQMLSDASILVILGKTISLTGLTVLAFVHLLAAVLNILIFAIFARAILSWFNPNPYYPGASLLASLTEPILDICRQLVPDMSGIDLSPLIGLVALQLLKMLLLPPLQELVRFIG